MVQLRGEPTTTANLSKGECSSVRRNGLCLCMCVCQCVIVWLCANVILSNLAVQTQVAQRVCVSIPGTALKALISPFSTIFTNK